MIETHCLWIGGRLSTMERLALASHTRVGHACRLWTYETPEGVPPGVHLEDARQILPRERVFAYCRGPGKGSVAAFSNLFRYKLLYERGGWWVDTDVVCLRPFHFAAAYVFASEHAPHGVQTASCAFKTPAGSPALAYCVETADARTPDSLNWGDTGPQLLAEAVGRFGLDDFVVPPETFCPVHFYEAEAVFHGPVDVRNAHAVHLWHEMWRRNGWDKDGVYPGDCLYETLKRKVLGE